MSGYTPVFSSVFDGTLHGRWPHTGIWVCLLAMADKHGCIDKVPRAIAADIGVDLETLTACIADFCAPDEYSRSAESDGRRLELIDPARPWGWRIVNHGKYREKARKAMHQLEATASGRDAERKRVEREREASRRVRTCPDVSSADRLSDTDTDKEKKGAGAPPLPEGLDPKAWEAWVEYRRSIGKKLKPASHPAAMKALAKYGAAQAAVVEQSIANGWQGLFELKAVPRPANKIDPREWM